MKKIYLAGQPNEFDSNWKNQFKKLEGFDCYDWELDSDQTSPDTFFPDDLRAVKDAEIMVANPGVAPSETTWIEVGYFYGNNTNNPGEFCNRLIIIWKEERQPEWSIEFVKKAGIVVRTFEEAMQKLKELK